MADKSKYNLFGYGLITFLLLIIIVHIVYGVMLSIEGFKNACKVYRLWKEARKLKNKSSKTKSCQQEKKKGDGSSKKSFAKRKKKGIRQRKEDLDSSKVGLIGSSDQMKMNIKQKNRLQTDKKMADTKKIRRKKNAK